MTPPRGMYYDEIVALLDHAGFTPSINPGYAWRLNHDGSADIIQFGHGAIEVTHYHPNHQRSHATITMTDTGLGLLAAIIDDTPPAIWNNP